MAYRLLLLKDLTAPNTLIYWSSTFVGGFFFSRNKTSTGAETRELKTLREAVTMLNQSQRKRRVHTLLELVSEMQ
jgi:hypothetical protein